MDQLTVQGRMTRSFAAATVGMGIALVLQITGFVTPGWFVLQYGDELGSKMEMGLWTTKICVRVGTRIREYQLETSIALGLLVISILLYSFLRSGSGSGNLKTIVYFTVFYTLISGILAVTAAGKQGNDVRKAHDLYTKRLGESPLQTPYSLILTGLGGILAGVMSAVILFVVKPWESETMPPSSYEMTAQRNVPLLLG